MLNEDMLIPQPPGLVCSNTGSSERPIEDETGPSSLKDLIVPDEKDVGITHSSRDFQLVTWDGPHDPANPHNWSIARKWFVTILVSLGSFITVMSGSMIAPALSLVSDDLHISSTVANLCLSSYLLAFAVMPLILAPMTEIWGRRTIWLVCGVMYTAWSIMCGFSSHVGVLIAGRILSGAAGSVDYVISDPVIWDIWRPEERGRGIAVGDTLPLIAPAVGPLVAAVITQGASWRWIFWFAAIFNAFIILLAFFMFPETSAPDILRRKARKLNDEKHDSQPIYRTEYDIEGSDTRQRITSNLSRPAKMLCTQPILQLTSIFLAYNSGLLYLVLSTYADLFTSVYHQTILQSGLHYLSIAIGYLSAIHAGGIFMDWIYARLHSQRADDEDLPEDRIPLLIPGSIILPIGLLWYGWAAEKRAHWIMCDIGGALFACGSMLSYKGLISYALDCYQNHTASASAASQSLRMLAAFAFPIFAPGMYERLGWGWANTLLAGLAAGFGVVAPVVLWYYGAQIRGRGRPMD